MISKRNNFFLLIILILLQSCSGGRIGNFLEYSFKNLEDTKIKEESKINLENETILKSEVIKEKSINPEKVKIKKELKINLENETILKSEDIKEKSINPQEVKITEDLKSNFKNKKILISEEKSKIKKRIGKDKKSLKKRKYEPQSYKIIFILKDVDPKDPTENLSTILRNSDVNFEIEKIERFFDSNNKNPKRN